MSAEIQPLRQGAPEPAVPLFIGGAWLDGEAGTRLVIDPATEAPMGAVALASDAQIDAAIAAAEVVGRAWRDRPALERGAILIRAATLLRERIDHIARLLTLEQGKTLAESRGELTRSVETLVWNGEEAPRIEGTVVAGRAPGSIRRRLPVPMGVVAAFAAWNFPAVLATRKLGAALAAGCTVVLKAAEEAPYTAAAIVACLDDAGLPKGVVNLVFGDPPAVAKRLLESSIVRKVTFTGSTRVGKELAALAAPDLKRCTFELGGHAPVILCADGDVDAAVAATIPFKFTSAGQSCIAPSRFYLHRSRQAEFIDKFARAARAIRVGDGRLPETKMGPVANARRLAAMESYVRDAQEQGATLVCGGRRVASPGWFFAPTVLADVPMQARVMNEEPFGPIAPMAAFDDLDEALALANRLPYGFAAYGFTASHRTAEHLSQNLAAGNIGINQMCPSLPDMPIGGLGDSGYGYEGGREGIEAFLHFKLVSGSF
jgi:succinate-semialdehyde dehydrogenase/glutarate-semialdehyde dehydrogenase